MGFNNVAPRQYFKIKEGNVAITVNASDEDKFKSLMGKARSVKRYLNKDNVDKIDINFTEFTGKLRKIDSKLSEFNGSKVKNWELFFEDNGTTYVCTMMYDGYQIQGLINCLSSIEGEIGPITLRPYKINDKTGMTILHKGTKLSWKFNKEEQPPLETKKTLADDGVTIIDDIDDKTGKPRINNKKRMEWLINLILKINDKIGADKYVVGTTEEVIDDEHDDDSEQPF